ncbi:COP9 signalosome complex subunit 8 [Pseudolycoriella hygida]|uniref:COP9 signalosome complex subunit 8 n=1 Tax=Pseudolycoriella hygida TaxID=35572 RepID=A0A9Q0S7N3_9DIPT|nr:COP9 signalosome complex subunit 8 [Pseudolycoriella hygida]
MMEVEMACDKTDKTEQLIDMLEKQEIEATIAMSAQLYAELFAAYLYRNELSKARYLWGRIPISVKNGNVELNRMWQIFTQLYDNDMNAFFKTINFEWSTNVAKLMSQLKDKVHGETIELVALAYSSIFEDCLCTMLNETPESLKGLCETLGWEIQSGSFPRLIIPKRKIVEKVDTATAEDQLEKLTDFVSFLEN